MTWTCIFKKPWIPAEDLADFNAAIVGPIEVVATFTEDDRIAAETGMTR